ncbi:MAG TPA: carboxypeptidase regulatory-like domain-containing protein [Blastocatellia bacterium]|nr:carboxypeptidase regulatory-like domain-containing protein [Blastocatellia bacterium]
MKQFLWRTVGFLFLSTIALAQTNTSLSGLVLDPAQAVIPGATITVENLKTGITSTTTSNDAGVYSFPSLQPGTYKITAEATGFTRLTIAEFILEIAARAALNLPMKVGVFASIDIRAAQDSALALGTNSLGGVLNGQRINELPLPDRNALDLVFTQGGLVGSNFSGARIGTLNITRDGVNVMDQRINSGVQATFFNSVDSVDEVKVSVSPADAEYGRGSGQVHITTKSGTNEFHGSLFEAHRNTVLNANNWFNNLRGLPRDTLLRNQFGARLGGPLWFPKRVFGPMNYDGRKRSFFFVAYEGLRERVREPVTATVFTATAKQGLFRFFPGVLNANANAETPTVDLLGNARKPSATTPDLQTISVFGRDANRSGFDPTGWVRRQLDASPLPNDFRLGDGLNTAGYTWLRPRARDANQWTLRFDHQFNDQHNLTLEYLHERGNKQNDFMPQPLPNTPGGAYVDDSNFYALSLVSTFSSRLVNEARAGASRTRARFFAPWETPSGRDFLPMANNQIFVPVFTSIKPSIDGSNDPQGRISPIYQYADTLTWLRGRHQFKAGGEVRFVSNNGFNSFTVVPRVNFGTGGVGITNLSATTVPGLSLNEGGARALLIDLAGSVSSVLQAFNAVGGANPVFLAGEGKQRTWRQREYSLFFKDEFKVTSSLGLNLGLRYEYYGVPWEANGRMAGLVNGSAGLFGRSGIRFNDLFQPGRLNGADTNVMLVGKNSPHEDVNIYRADRNNFAPAVGLSWNLPWFVFRAGYSVGYERSSFRLLDIVAGDLPGLRTTRSFTSASYLNLSRITLPLTPTGRPLETVPLTDRIQNVRVFDSNLRTPYVQNWNAILQRQLGQTYSLEVRYVGNKGTKLIRGANINEANIFESGVLEAFRLTQEGGDAALFERIFFNLNLGLGRIGSTVGGRPITASASLRANDQTAPFFANNDVGGFARFLNNSPLFTGTRGGLLLRNPNLPVNLIVANPQFDGAILMGNFANSTYHSFQVELNKRLADGVLLQANYTFSKALGEEEGSTEEQRSDYRTLRNLRLDKRRLSFDHRHIVRSNGIFELPFGPGRRFLSNSNAVLARLVERWQVGVIYNWFSGAPLPLTSGIASFNQLANNTPVLLGEVPRGSVTPQRVANGVVLFPNWQQVADPARDKLTTQQSLQQRSSLRAIADASGRLLLVNPAPGTLGTLPLRSLTAPHFLRFDANLIKRFRLRETMNFELRLDAIDLLNTPQFAVFDTDINSTTFGRVTGATGERLVVVGVRLNF